MRRFRSLWICSLLSVATSACSPDARQTRVFDGAGMLTPVEAQRISEFHALMLRDFDIDYVVATTQTDGDINRQSLQLFAETATGSLSDRGRGLLLLINPLRGQVRLEVSAALEPVFVDAFVAYIEQRQMIPFFTRARVADGILATTELIVLRAQNAANGAGFADEPWTSVALGGGATSAIEKPLDHADQAAPTADSSEAPDQVVQRYLKAMRERNSNLDSAIYTDETRKLFANWVITPAQMDTIAKTYRQCRQAKLRTEGSFAVVRYAPGDRLCAPWFLKQEQQAWRLDLATMQRVIGFGRNNAWHLRREVNNPYAFAFADWQFDRNGYPRESR